MRFFDRERATASTHLAEPAEGAWQRLRSLAGGQPDARSWAGPEGTRVKDWARPQKEGPGALPSEAHVVRIVRRALQEESAASPLTERIHGVARRLAGADWALRHGDPEPLVRHVARVILAGLRGRLDGR
jgi:hypothetical protein